MQNINLTQEESDIIYNLLVHEIEYEEDLRDSKDESYDRSYMMKMKKLLKKVQALG